MFMSSTAFVIPVSVPFIDLISDDGKSLFFLSIELSLLWFVLMVSLLCFFSKVLIFIWLDSIETKKVCIFLWFHDLGYLQFVLGWALWL